MKLIPIKDENMLKENSVFYTPGTLYQYFHRQKWPGVFVNTGPG